MPTDTSTGLGVRNVILDGTSYSGADVKILIHVPDPVFRERIRSTQELLVQARIAGEDSNASFYAQELEQLQANTPSQIKVLAEAQSLSVSTYREKYPVRSIGTTYPRGFTRGPRTIAGSIVFTVFDKNVLYEILAPAPGEIDRDALFSTAIIDQLPPFNITVTFANELGQASQMNILGCEFVSEGQTMSIHDMFIENTAQYIARDIDPMFSSRDRRVTLTGSSSLLASDLLRTPEAQQYKVDTDPFERWRKRNNPFE